LETISSKENNMHLWGKIMGWLQFGLQAVTQVTQQTGQPHGWANWLTLFASLAAAVGIHAASSTDGTK
jgi:hypothetical protein